MSKTTNKFSPEVRERAVRMVMEQRAEYGSEWEVMKSIAAKLAARWRRCAAGAARRRADERGQRRWLPMTVSG